MIPRIVKDGEASTEPYIQRSSSPHDVRSPRRRATMHVMVGDSKLRPARKQTSTGAEATHEASSSLKGKFPFKASSSKPCVRMDRNIAAEVSPPALVARCIECGTAYRGAAENAKFCLSCGEHRMDNQPFDELFDALVNQRVIMRKTDLTTLNLKIDNMMQDLRQSKRKSTMKQMMDST